MYVGITADEPVRLARLNKAPNRSSLLAERGYTGEMAKKLCDSYGLLSPAYRELSIIRGGCWMCEFAKLGEHRLIRDQMPEIWEEFVSLEELSDLAMPRWAPTTKETLKGRNDRLIREEKNDESG